MLRRVQSCVGGQWCLGFSPISNKGLSTAKGKIVHVVGVVEASSGCHGMSPISNKGLSTVIGKLVCVVGGVAAGCGCLEHFGLFLNKALFTVKGKNVRAVDEVKSGCLGLSPIANKELSTVKGKNVRAVGVVEAGSGCLFGLFLKKWLPTANGKIVHVVGGVGACLEHLDLFLNRWLCTVREKRLCITEVECSG